MSGQAATRATPRASVVIPTWNGRDLLEICLPSLGSQDERDFEVVVVDNGSTDGTREWLEREHPRVRRVGFSENRGFAAAVNAGIEASAGRIVVLLNNDTEVEPGWLSALLRALDSHPDAGFCASRMLSWHDRSILDGAGDQMGLFASPIGHGAPDGPEYDRPRYVLSACAGAAAYRREVFETIGGFDERFGSYLEDVDVGIRAQLAGYRCLYVPDAVVYHMGSATAKRMSRQKLFMLQRNALYLFLQYMPARVLLRWGPLMLPLTFVIAWKQGQPFRWAARSILAAARDARGIARRRREAEALRKVPLERVLELFSPPIGHGPPAPHDWPAPHGEVVA